MKWILTLSVLTFLSSVLAVDYACPDGKSKKSITIKKDQTFNFDVAPGYGAKTKCSVMYKPSKSKKTKCKKLKFSCTTFDLPNKDAKKCRKGDKLRVGKQFFCKSKSPSIQSTKPIKLMFMSDKKDSSGSATCTIECVGSTPAPSPPTTTTGTGILISGGYQRDLGKVSYHVEFYYPETNTSCTQKRLPIDRIDHTSVEGVLCGGHGKETKRSCVDMFSGKWSSKKYSPIRPRTEHVSWNLNPGESFYAPWWGIPA